MPLSVSPGARILIAILAGFLLLVGPGRVHVHAPDHHHASEMDGHAVDDASDMKVEQDAHGEDGGWGVHVHPCNDVFAPSPLISELPTTAHFSVMVRRIFSTSAPDGIPLAVDLPPVES